MSPERPPLRSPGPCAQAARLRIRDLEQLRTKERTERSSGALLSDKLLDLRGALLHQDALKARGGAVGC